MNTPVPWLKNIFEDTFYSTPYDGQFAVNKVHEILGDNPACVQLADDVAGFLGELFSIALYGNTDGGCLGLYDDGKRRLLLRLGMLSGTVREVLVHELLHGYLLRLRFPFPDPNGCTVIETYHYVTYNFVAHAIMFPMYEGLGLDPGKFYGQSGGGPNTDVDADISFTDWLIQWFAVWQTYRHTENEIEKHWLEATWKIVQDKFPGIGQASEQIERWYDRGEFRQPEHFVKSYDELMLLMQIETIASEDWLYFQTGATEAEIRNGCS